MYILQAVLLYVNNPLQVCDVALPASAMQLVSFKVCYSANLSFYIFTEKNRMQTIP